MTRYDFILARRYLIISFKVESFRRLLKITQLAPWKSFLVIMGPDLHAKFTKSVIRSSWSGVEHCSKSHVKPLGSHIWSLLVPIHTKS